MRDLRRYWQEVREIERGLPESVWLVSLDSGDLAPGFLVEVPAAPAARLLHAKSHRLATPAEIELRESQEASKRRAQQEATLRKQGIAVVEARPAAKRR